MELLLKLSLMYAALKKMHTHTHTHTHTHLTALFRDYPGEPVPEGKTNLDLNEARDSEWRWHQLGKLQTDNHTSTPLLIFTGWMPFLPQPTASKH